MAQRLLSLLIILALPFLLVVSSIRILWNDWAVNVEYNRPGFPPDPYGFTLEQRLPLALAGLHSVLPQSEGMILLQQAKLPNGAPAFNEREIKHMNDVRILIGVVYPMQLIGLGLIVILSVALHRSSKWRSAVPLGLRWGTILTLALLAGLILYIVLNFDSFFLTFHRLFFEGDTFMFRFDDTLIRLYPEQLWSDAFIFIGVLTVVMALAVLAISQVWVRRIGESANQRER
jgi:integral membrane protein (TIGR01906 family)